MQQRRYRPGDVVDDYCPRERRITDHAIVAMIDGDIKQTRCVVCDAEHEYKDGKVPAQRRKKPQAALYTQVLEGLQGPQPAARLSPQPESDADVEPDVAIDEPAPEPVADVAALPVGEAVVDSEMYAEPPPSVAAETFGEEPRVGRDDRPWRRQLIRAALPRPEGHVPQPTRQMPEFTVRQPTSRAAHRHGGRRGGAPTGNGGGGNGSQGPMRFGRDSQQPHAGQRQNNGRRRRRGKKQ